MKKENDKNQSIEKIEVEKILKKFKEKELPTKKLSKISAGKNQDAYKECIEVAELRYRLCIALKQDTVEGCKEYEEVIKKHCASKYA